MAHQSEQVKRAIAQLRADPTLTRYQAAKQNGLTAGALYNSIECKKLMQERKQGAKA